MMPLRRFPPITRTAGWRGRVTIPDPIRGGAQDLTNSVLTLALYRVEDRWGWRDYGRSWFNAPCFCPQSRALFVQTNVANDGVFTILPSKKSAEFLFQPEDVVALCDGPYLVLVVIQDAYGTREVFRERVYVLPGCAILPVIEQVPGLISGSVTDISGSVTNSSGVGPGTDN